MRFFQALVMGMIVVAPASYAEPKAPPHTPDFKYQRCVQEEALALIRAPATATEIAQAALHRCLNEEIGYRGFVMGRSPDSSSWDKADKAVLRFNEQLLRMAISDVIEARMAISGRSQ